MEARVKATGEIIEVKVYKREHRLYIRIEGEKTGEIYRAKDLDFNIEDDNTPDYWTRLEHQYAGMAMQGLMTILPNIGGLQGRTPKDEIVDIATATAHALVEKMKEERE